MEQPPIPKDAFKNNNVREETNEKSSNLVSEADDKLEVTGNTSSCFCDEGGEVEDHMPKDRGDGLQAFSKDKISSEVFLLQSEKNLPGDITQAFESDRLSFPLDGESFSNDQRNISAYLHPEGGGDFSASLFTFPKSIQKTSPENTRNSGSDDVYSVSCFDRPTTEQEVYSEVYKVQDWSTEDEDYKLLNSYFMAAPAFLSERNTTELNASKDDKKVTQDYNSGLNVDCTHEKQEQGSYPRIRYTRNYLMQYADCALAYSFPSNLGPFTKKQELPLRQLEVPQLAPTIPPPGLNPWNAYPNMQHLTFYQIVQEDINTRRRATKSSY